MKHNYKVQTMVISALLCAIGIVIPMVSPRIVIGPASYTLASHVPIFIAMFISPVVAVSVALITGFGFLFAGFPFVVVLRALSHLLFAFIGAQLIKKHGNILYSVKGFAFFGLFTAILHALGEVIVVTFFYWGNNMSGAYYQQGYWISVMALVGLGTIVHSMVDLGIAVFVWKHVQSVIKIPVCAKI
ncbi:hypothetical protein V6615_03710 [Oscillospiraceae bacterium PP1C4]